VNVSRRLSSLKSPPTNNPSANRRSNVSVDQCLATAIRHSHSLSSTVKQYQGPGLRAHTGCFLRKDGHNVNAICWKPILPHHAAGTPHHTTQPPPPPPHCPIQLHGAVPHRTIPRRSIPHHPTQHDHAQLRHNTSLNMRFITWNRICVATRRSTRLCCIFFFLLLPDTTPCASAWVLHRRMYEPTGARTSYPLPFTYTPRTFEGIPPYVWPQHGKSLTGILQWLANALFASLCRNRPHVLIHGSHNNNIITPMTVIHVLVYACHRAVGSYTTV
jgi:hypothetical protein